jgi:ATP-dependent Clp protease ATP-binding subunit ClpA
MGPFDRFNDRAKRVLALAQDEAIRLNHNYIGTEHVLLGLIREGEGVAARALESLGVELSKARKSVESIVGRGEDATELTEITLSPRTKRVVEYAIDEARKLGHMHVGTEHLLLGLVREGEGIAAGVLQSLGVTLDRARQHVLAAMGQPAAPETARPVTRTYDVAWTYDAVSPLDRLSTSARRAVALAYWEAGRANADQLRTDHLLLGIVDLNDAWITQLLVGLAVAPSDLIARVEQSAARRDGPRPPNIRESPEVVDTFTRSATIAAERRSAVIRPEHLLLAIASGDQSMASTLKGLGATPDRIRAVLDNMR